MSDNNSDRRRYAANLLAGCLSGVRKLVIYDLEWTSWPGFGESGWQMPEKHREIIQIGAVALDLKRDFMEVGSLNVFVKPKINPVLSEYIQSLTGLTQKKIDDEGMPFPAALERLNVFSESADGTCANGLDGIVIAENCELFDLECPRIYKETHNLRPLLREALPADMTVFTSGELTALFGLDSVGNAHDALSDARGIAAALKYLCAD